MSIKRYTYSPRKSVLYGTLHLGGDTDFVLLSDHEAAIGELKAALQKYGLHKIACPIADVFPVQEGIGYVCTCGLDAALRGKDGA